MSSSDAATDTLLDALARRDSLLLEERARNEELVLRLENQVEVARALAGLASPIGRPPSHPSAT